MSDIELPIASGKHDMYDSILCCPRCGCNNLHINGTVKGSFFAKDTDDVRISFNCEGCGGENTPDLCFHHYKGCTYMYWDGEQEAATVENVRRIWGKQLGITE